MKGRVELSLSTWCQPVPAVLNPERSPVLEHIADRIQTLGHRRVRVGVDGRTAAGKTTLGHELAMLLADADRVVLRASLDDFKRPWAEAHLYDRTSGDGYYRNAFDLQAIHRLLLEPAGPDYPGLVALCSIDPITQVDHAHVRVAMPDDGILIVDGVFAFRPELKDYWDLRIWVDIDPELSIRRGIDRDSAREGTDTAEMLHRERYGVAEAIYITEADPVSAADIVIDNTDLDGPRIMRS